MRRSITFLLALAALPVSATALYAQSESPSNSAIPSYTQSQAAPIVRIAPPKNSVTDEQSAAQADEQSPKVIGSRPAQGVLLRYLADSSVQIVSATAERTEIRVERGIANVDVHNPAPKSLILVDLPGGQAQLLKNGLYTFNAETNTVRVMLGEAYAFPNSSSSERIKVKGNRQVAFVGSDIHATGFDNYQANADLLPTPGGRYPANAFDGETRHSNPYYFYGSPYGYYGYPYGYFGDPYLAWGYPFGWGPGWGWGGMGFYGGFGGVFFPGGGFRGVGRR